MSRPAGPRDVIDLAGGEVLLERDVGLTARDGVRLSADVYRPNRPGRFPALLEHIPYRKDDLEAGGDRGNGIYLATNGLVAVRLDVRGTGNSGGIAHDEYTVEEQRDGVEAVSWIAEQQWCTGKVGSWGVSYGGFACIQLAALQPPALAAIAPVFATDDRYTDDMHFSGGALCALELAHYPLRILAMNALPPAKEPGEGHEAFRDRWLERAGATPPWVVRWLEEQLDGPYWRNGSLRPDPSRIRCPVLLVAGWRDGYRTAMLRLASSLSTDWQLLAGPWMHTMPDEGVPGPRYPFRTELVRWFRRHLGGEHPHPDARPRTVFFLTEFDPPSRPPSEVSGRWLGSDSWPQATDPPVSLHLQPDGSLAEQPAAGQARVACPVAPAAGVTSGNWCPPPPGHGLPSDQRPDEARSAVFTSAPLEAPLDVLGPPMARLRVDHPGPSALVAVKLADVSPDGESQLVTSGVLNLAHRAGHERPAPAEGPVDVEIALQATGWRFLPGHRVRVAVAGSDWPTVWPLSTTDPVTLRLGDGAPGRLELPGLPADSRPYEPAGAPQDLDLGGWRYPPKTTTWRIATDPTARTSGIDASDAWRGEDPGEGVRVAETRHYRALVGEADPLSAEVIGEAMFDLERPGLSVRSTASGRFGATADSFTYEIVLDVREGDRVLHERTWRGEVPRRLC